MQCAKKKSMLILCMLFVLAAAAAGCGTNRADRDRQNKDSSSAGTSETGSRGTETAMETDGTDNQGVTDPDMSNKDQKSGDGLVGGAAQDLGEGAGQAVEDVTRGTGQAAEEVTKGAGQAAKDVAEGAGEASKDIGRGAGEAVDDVADGLSDALDNLGGGSFDRYEDARDYLMKTLQRDNAQAHYEFRNEKKDLVSYNNADADARGYEFSVFETDGNEKIGRYYVDKENGKIYRYMGKNSIEGY